VPAHPVSVSWYLALGDGQRLLDRALVVERGQLRPELNKLLLLLLLLLIRLRVHVVTRARGVSSTASDIQRM
jgi:hypothetical protein